MSLKALLLHLEVHLRVFMIGSINYKGIDVVIMLVVVVEEFVMFGYFPPITVRGCLG